VTASWPVAFLWTLALELPVYTGLLGRRFAHWWSVAVLTLLVNLATHPALWFLFPRFGPPALWMALAEGTVTLVEAALITAALARSAGGPAPMAPSRGARLRLALSASLLANLFSAGIGWLCR
jgi:hypothetical protein